MANNRLYLKCPFCGECVLLGKSMGRNFYTPYTGDPPQYEGRIQEFFEKHWECYIYSDLTGVDGGIFTLEDEMGTYESDTFGEGEKQASDKAGANRLFCN